MMYNVDNLFYLLGRLTGYILYGPQEKAETIARAIIEDNLAGVLLRLSRQEGERLIDELVAPKQTPF